MGLIIRFTLFALRKNNIFLISALHISWLLNLCLEGKTSRVSVKAIFLSYS